jgi:hypothetical protein
MANIRILVGATFGVLALTSGMASAQPPLPYQTPTVSPYLNLLRTGTPTSLNYYNLVRPQIDFNSSITQLSQQTALNRQGINNLQQQSTAGTNSTLPPTGFIPQFQSQRSYFLTYSGTGMGGANQIPSRGSGAVNPRAMGVPTLGSPGTGGLGLGLGVGRVP